MRTKKTHLLALGRSAITIVAMTASLFLFNAGAAAGTAQAAALRFHGVTRTIARGGAASVSGAAPAAQAPVSKPEIAQGPRDEGDAASTGGSGGSGASSSVGGAAARPVARSAPNPRVVTSFDGLNHRQQRLANGGNQFSLEPPDQGLCANGSFELESINDVLQVYDPHGAPQLNGGNAVDLNTFYGYPPAINRTTNVYGQFITDPSCYYDPDTRRWFNVVLTLEVDPALGPPNFTGDDHLDLAVSLTSDPRGSWAIYRIPAQDNGTQGTPNHACSKGFCLGDYPHIGADRNGIYVTTNEYSFFGPEFHGAQIYALSKRALASAAPSLLVTQFDTTGAHPGFTVWPATAPSGYYEDANHGTEYFLSSTAADEVTCPSGCVGPRMANNILQWTLSNTPSLDSSSPDLTLVNQSIDVQQYSAPPHATQQVGPTPLRDCLNDKACSTFLNGAPDPFAPEVEYALDSNDTRMQQVTFANGQLWGALDTAVTVGGTSVAGIAFYIVDPHSGHLNRQGQVGLADTNLIYPAIGVLPSGKGVVTFTLSGMHDFPSAAYAGIDDQAGFGTVHLAASGVGPADGFSGYALYNAPNPNRPRWGDFGYTAVVGSHIWIGSEYIGQACTLSQYEAGFTSQFGSCAGTRTALANWDTRITEVNV